MRPSKSIKSIAPLKGGSKTVWRIAGATAAAALASSMLTPVAHADPSLSELAAEIQALKAENRSMRAENREMKAAITEMRGQTHRTSEKVRAIAARTPAPGVPYALPPPGPALPVGATPAFVTADKKLQFGAITITPGGFIAAESVFRTKTINSDINSGFGAIPFNSSPAAHVGESRLTARQSRVALLAEGLITPTLLASSYGEFDFLGSSTASNATDTNRYVPGIRNLYAALDMSDYGLHVLAGQNWSLLTLNSKGITPRNEVAPPVIDGQFIPGFTFARQAQIRLTKDFDKKLWISLSAEESSTTFGGAGACNGGALVNGGVQNGTGMPIIVGFNGTNYVCAITGSGAGFSQYGQPYALNHVPDVIGKVAYEATLGQRDIHLEAMGLYKDLYDRSYQAPGGAVVLGSGQNHDATGFGFGGGLIVPVIPRRLDFQASALAGRGIGRYGTGLLPDASFNANGALRPIAEIQSLVGLTLHATPSIDIYGFAGIEKEARSVLQTPAGTYYGYGLPNVDDTGCAIDSGTTNKGCGGSTKALYSVAAGFWDKIYKGNFGEVRVGANYSFTRRELFSTPVGATPVFSSPKADEHMIFTSMRYYPFQ